MEKSKLGSVFFSLTNKELKEFSLFISSPYYNRRQEVIALFSFLMEHKELPIGSITKEKAWKYVFPDEQYDDGQMRYTMSFLLKCLKEFLIQKEVSKNESYTSILLCRALRHRGIDDLYKKEMQRTVSLQEKQPYRNAHFHYNNYLLQLEHEEVFSSQDNRVGDPPLQKSIDELTHFYISDILRQSCSALSYQSMLKGDYILNFQKEVLEHVANSDYSDKPAISIYYNGYRAMSDLDDEEHFKILKRLIHQYWSKFPMEESRSIYVLAINCCIKRLNKGKRQYIRECFELYRSGLENKVLLENGVISNYTYTNASKLALALKEFEWVESFLREYKTYLPANDRENVFNYNLAFVYFQKPDYENAMVLLQKVDFKNVLNNLDVRRMLLRIYYELEYYDLLESLLDSFKIYLSRQKNIGYHKDNYANLIYFVKKMLRTNLHDRAAKSKLVAEVEATPSIAEKSWLLEQLV